MPHLHYFFFLTGITGGLGKGPDAIGRRNKKAEAAALAAAEHARKYGICAIPIRMAPFFAGKANILICLLPLL